MQAQNAVQLAWHLLRLSDNTGQIFLGQDNAEKRVSLFPAGFVLERIVALVQRSDIGKRRVVDHLADIGKILVRRLRASGYLDGVLVLFPANTVSVTA